MTHSTRPRASLPLILLLAALAGPADAAAQPDVLRTCSRVPALKASYLACERAALGGEMPAGEIARCSVVYERLKDRAFDGSFRALRAWYETVSAAGVGTMRAWEVCG